ncbi:MAG: tRNA lysidine(34) synthetase TilS, partial [Chloroflexi bacterium]|nr:tRNA lysidine(34) synthetase TilS [Chloroflexota bacterium]
LRYQLLAAVAHDCGARAVALGHTADDQAETVLLHLARGASLEGLAAMRPLDPWPFPEQAADLSVVRPLLAVTRRDTEAYCRWLGLRPRRDPTNESLAFRRNVVRHRVLPALARVNPRAAEAIARAASLLRADADYLQEQAELALGRAAQRRPWGLELERSILASLPRALLGRVLHRALRQVTAGEVAHRHVEALARACAGPAGAQLDLPGGAIAYVDYRTILLGEEEALPCPLPPLPGPTPIAVPGETEADGWRCRAALEPPGGQPCESPWVARLDAAQVGTGLVLRGRRPGDRFQPLGLEQPKKLQDFLVDARVPRRWRDRVPLVVAPSAGAGQAGERLAWVAGYRIAHWARVTASTRQVLRLELVRA